MINYAKDRVIVTKNMRKYVLVGAFLMLFLGLGNYSFGAIKETYYLGISAEQVGDELTVASNSQIPFLDSKMTLEQEMQYSSKVEARLSFYRVVKIGGVCFIAVGLILFAVWKSLGVQYEH